MASRGMNMRDMKAVQMGKRPRGRPSKTEAKNPSRDERGSPPEDEDAPDDFELGEQADGHHMPVQRKAIELEPDNDLPDEPPPGWDD